MKTIVLMLALLYCIACDGQSTSCNLRSDTLLIFYIEIFKPKNPPQQLWATGKQFDAGSIDTSSIASFVTSFFKDKNYCSDLPGGYREELLKCFKDSGTAFIEKLEKAKGNVYELFNAMKESFKREFVLEDGCKVQLGVVRCYGSFLMRNLETDKLGVSTDEYPIEKGDLPNKVVAIPFRTFPLDVSIK